MKNNNAKIELKNIGEACFREFLQKIVYIKPNLEFKKRFSKNIKELFVDEGFLVYGYIDEMAGFTFEFLCPANINNNTLSFGEIDYDNSIKLRRGMLNGCEFADIECYNIDYSVFSETIERINEVYKPSNEYVEKMRDFAFLDEFRNSDYPDDLIMVLYEENLKPELVWVKSWSYTKNELFGKLLNEPEQNFGVHINDIVGFALGEIGDGKTMCFYTGNTLKECDNV